MRALIGGLCLLMIASGLKAEEGRRERKTQTPYSNEAVAREREARRVVREIDRDRREERREYDYQRRAREARD